MRKRIIFTVTNDLTYDQRMHKICGSLSNAGYDVTLVGRKLSRSLPLDDKSFKQERLNCFFNKGKLFYLEYNFRLFFYLLFLSCDIICAIDLDTILPCLMNGKLRNKKLVYDAHEYFTQVPEVIHRPAVQKVWEWVEKFAVPKMDLCYTVSYSLAELFEKKYNKKFQVIKNVPFLKTNANKEDIEEGTEEKFILYQGALNAGRGLVELISAMQELPLKLLIAGEGDLSNKLRQLTKDLKLENKVIFLGYKKPEALKELTPKAFIGFNLLENAGESYFYSLSNKFFDYIHAAVPGISNDFPEYIRINKNFEVSVLISLSTENIITAVNKLLQDKEYYNKLKRNCLLAKVEYNWQHEEKLLVSLYNEL